MSGDILRAEPSDIDRTSGHDPSPSFCGLAGIPAAATSTPRAIAASVIGAVGFPAWRAVHHGVGLAGACGPGRPGCPRLRCVAALAGPVRAAGLPAVEPTPPPARPRTPVRR